MKMNNNVYGLIGIGVKNANWNADFDKLPKRNSDDIIKGSSYALQYCIKNQWNNLNEKVLGLKSMQDNGVCTTLTQRYQSLFGVEDNGFGKKDTDEVKKGKLQLVRNNLLSCKDVRNFGIAYTGATNMSIKGVVQFTDGENKYEDTTIIEERILSPYANPNSTTEGGATTNTLGVKYTTDKAHYIYDFSVFPKEYDKYISNDFEGYTEDDYNDFKSASLIAVSNYNSKAKAGCKNEFAMFIKTKQDENYLLDLNCLQDYVKVYDNSDETRIMYDLTEVNKLLKDIEDKIEDIEVYYNPRTVEITEITATNTKIFDLITRKEL